jgi:transketolase
MRNTIINKITEKAARDKNIFMVTGDAGFGVLDEYKDRFPHRFLNLGVAEQNMISFSAGLALAGHRVFVYNIIPFLLYRCYEQVRNDICYQRLPVTLIGIGSGVTYAPQGITHYAVEDIALARTLPNLAILSPSDPLEAERCAEYALESRGPLYIRVAKSGERCIYKIKPQDITEPRLLKKGKRVAVLFHGSIASEVMAALEGLRREITLISVPMLHPLDFNSLSEIIKDVRALITVEEHYVEGGLGSIIAEWLLREGRSLRLRKLGINNEFIHAIKNTIGMRELYGISADKIRRVIMEEYERR